MNIFITGATGFIGSSVTRILSKHHHVTVLLRKNADTFRIKDCLSQIQIITGELADRTLIAESLMQIQPDVIIHLAWAGVENQFRNDMLQIDNVANTCYLLESAIKAGATAFVGLGSQAEYGPYNSVIDETFLTNPTTLYGAAKLSTYFLTERMALLQNIRFAWLRIFSTYGPGDHPSWLIPYLIRTLEKGERPSLTLGEQQWDYLYVDDAAQAIADCATHSSAQGVFNLASGDAVTLRNLIEMIRDKINPHLPLGFGEVPYRPDQVMHLQGDITRLKQIVGWQPRMPLLQGLHQTIDWYRQNT